MTFVSSGIRGAMCRTYTCEFGTDATLILLRFTHDLASPSLTDSQKADDSTETGMTQADRVRLAMPHRACTQL